MKNPKLHIAAMALMALVACQREDVGGIQHPDAIKLHLTIGKQTEAIDTRVDPTDKNATSFAPNDQIAISNGGEFMTYTLRGDEWQSEANKFLKWTNKTMTFEAYYPISPNTSVSHFTLPEDQSSKDKLATADYMTSAAKEHIRPQTGTQLDMSFTRHTAQVVVRIAAFSGEFVGTPAISNLRIYSPHSGYTNTSATGTSMQITPYTEATDRYALVIPEYQHTQGNFITLTVTDGNGSKSLSVNGIPSMLAGKRYTYNLTVGNGQITVGNVTVEDWGNDVSIPDVDALLIKSINGVEFQFAYVKAGTFQMGSPESEAERFEDELQHWVKLSKDYYISRTEITQQQWQAIMTPGNITTDINSNTPMRPVSWEQICTGQNSFLTAINALGGGVFDLPTEAQWEYAARGGVRAKGYMKYPGVNTDNDLRNYAYYKDNPSLSFGNGNPTFVGLLYPNELNMCDMGGNVWEWCKDSWDESENYPTNTTQANPVIDPIVSTGNQRVIRGGASMTQATNMRTAARFFYHPQASDNYTGFRLVLQIP